MPFILTRTDVHELEADAKVIASCPYRTGSRSSDWQPDLWAEERMIRQMQPGQAMVTSGRNFDAKCGIVAVPPIWEGGSRKETLHLAACYDNALRLAHKRRCRSVAFPLLSGDCNGFPRDLALETAIRTIKDFLEKHELLVYVSVKDAWAQHLPKPAIPALAEKNQASRLSTQALFEQMIRGTAPPVAAREAAPAEAPVMAPAPQKASPFGFLKPKHLDQLVSHPEDSFSAALLQYIDAKGLKDPQVYQKANLDRRLFSKIRTNAGYQPSKSTALALCLALELSLEETEEMLKKAGYALSDSSSFDIIVKYYISQGEFDLYTINEALFVYEQPLLGA